MLKKVLNINGIDRTLIVDPEATLADVLRKQLMLTGCKIGCGNGQCGSCSVIVDGKVIRACTRKIRMIDDKAEIETIEGIGTPDNLHPLQLSWIAHGGAQCGFCTPGFIMSAKQLLDENNNPTREEVRDWFQRHRNACRCTGYIPLVDAVMDAAKVIRGEMMKSDLLFKPVENNITGTYYHRPSGIAKVTGTWDFGADIALQMPEDTLHLALVQAKEFHANLLSIDISEAEKMPGVYKVITHEDVRGNNRIHAVTAFPTHKGSAKERPVLCDEKIFQFGDAIAIVAASTEEEAKAAAEKVTYEVELLPAYMDAPSAMAEDAIEIHPGTPNIYFEIENIKGEETAPLIEKAKYRNKIEARTSRQPHLNIEPDTGSAYIDEEGRLTIHSKSVALHIHHAMIVEGIGIEAEKLRLVQNPAGGTFGYKFNPTMESLLGVACLACDGKPVTLTYDMYQQITYTGKRSPVFSNMEIACDEEGKIIALEGHNFIDHGPYSEYGDLLGLRLSQFHFASYNVPNIRTKASVVSTNHQWGTAFRGFGTPEIQFASEIAMDEMAEKIGMDPFEFRYINLLREGDTMPVGSEPEVYSLPEMFDTLRPDYEETKKRIAKKNKDSDGKYKYGVGIAVGICPAGLDGVDTSEAWVELQEDGKILVGDSWEDHGQGADIGSLTMAHETLKEIGIKPEDIKLLKNDMAYTPNSGAAGGSRSTVFTGNAIRLACEALVEAMKKSDGSIRSYKEMVEEEIPTRHEGKWLSSGDTASDLETSQGRPFSTHMYQVFMSEVKVDTETGETEVERINTVADVGVVMNKSVVDGQMYGGISQGIGYALSEDFEDYEKHTSLMACGLPYIKDVPDAIELKYVETYREEGAYGASGCGESPNTASHTSIINAIYNACGVRIKDLPALPEKIKAELDK